MSRIGDRIFGATSQVVGPVRKKAFVLLNSVHTPPHRSAADYSSSTIKDYPANVGLSPDEVPDRCRIHSSYIGVGERALEQAGRGVGEEGRVVRWLHLQ
jgi:hypothetical protein